MLASASPRRSDLLRGAGVPFEIDVSGVDETLREGEVAGEFARRVARDKALEVSLRQRGRWVLAADTVVTIDGAVLGKPLDACDAVRMLNRLSGRRHQVVTAFAVVDPQGRLTLERQVSTEVEFRTLEGEETRAYVESGEPFGKAGAYAIQGGASGFVRRLEGSYTNVVGLPVTEVLEALAELGAWSSP